jgi:hypothetical protein
MEFLGITGSGVESSSDSIVNETVQVEDILDISEAVSKLLNYNFTQLMGLLTLSYTAVFVESGGLLTKIAGRTRPGESSSSDFIKLKLFKSLIYFPYVLNIHLE